MQPDSPLGSPSEAKAFVIARDWAIYSVIGTLAGIPVMAVMSLLTQHSELVPVGLLPFATASIGQCIVLHRVMPRFRYWVYWITLTVCFGVVALHFGGLAAALMQGILKEGDTYAMHSLIFELPMLIVLYGFLSGVIQQWLLRHWLGSVRLWTVATMIGSVLGVLLVGGVDWAVQELVEKGVLGPAFKKPVRAITTTDQLWVGAPLMMSVSVMQSLFLMRSAILKRPIKSQPR